MIDPIAALEAIGKLPDAEIDIAEAALQLARIDAPDSDWRAARAHLSLLAREAVAAAADIPEDDLVAQTELLATLLADHHGYRGAAAQYEEADSANLIRVIERRRGLPVALGVVWLHTIAAIGWRGHGVNFPGHFLVAIADATVTGGSRQIVIDVFGGGQALSVPTLRTMIKAFEGERAELRPGLLRPMGNRAVLLRLQNNIRTRRHAAGDTPGALAATENILRIAPDEAWLWREAAGLQQRLDQVSAAVLSLTRFLALVPDGEAADEARGRIGELRSRLN